MSYLPTDPDDTKPDRGIRLPSWDGAPVPPPREWVGPKRFGYPPLRRSRYADLEHDMAEMQRRMADLEDVLERIGLPAGER